MDEQMEIPVIARVIPMLFGLIFAAIGVTVIVSLWSRDGDFPPLVFRMVGSLISLAFVVMGGGLAISAMVGKVARSGKASRGVPGSPGSRAARASRRMDRVGGGGGYACTRCGAPLAKEADVSPLGDVRCSHCGGWFNIHRRQPRE